MPEQTRIDSALATAVKRLAAVGDSPRLDAELLLCQALDVARSYLFAHPEDTLDDAAIQRFDALLVRRETGVPMAYIRGTQEFWSLELMVSPATLVPRPETELLVQETLALMPRDSQQSVLDLGTGSGAIALAIASERRESRVVATDRSPGALAIARENSRQMEIINVEFAQGDWLEAVPGQRFDIIVSNPPYVREEDKALQALRHEPRDALVSGADGLDDVRHLASACLPAITDGGHLLLEHGADQGDGVIGILETAGWTNVRCKQDLAGLPRVTIADAPGTG